MRLRHLALLALLCSLVCSMTAVAADGPHARTDKGEIEGKLSDDGAVRIFLGIPYAAPPTGSMRWKPPQPAAAWQGVRNAQSYGMHCMQVNRFEDMQFHDAGESEDCLSLNVWTPAPKQEGAHAAQATKLPVMVWIYGGGFASGSTSEQRQDGESFARKGVVLVSMNYRLNIFGFFAHPALAAESPQHAAGNYGLMDQAAALQWVKRNIAAFGGDPNNITVFGQSAGSASVSAQMASPMAKDTLAHAIGESGGAFSRAGLSFAPRAQVEAKDQAFAQGVLGKSTLAELRAMPATDLVKAVEAQKTNPIRFGPCVDGLFVTESVADIFAAGKQAHIPLLAGWVRDEGGLQKDSMTLQSYRETVQQQWGPNADGFLRAYPASTDAEARRSMADYDADRSIAGSTWEWIEAQVKTGGAPVYRYRFEQPSPGGRYHPAPAVFHSSEIEYVFGNLSARPAAPWTASDYELSEIMQDYWIHFATTGDPNGAGPDGAPLPKWPVYSAADNWQVMHISDTALTGPASSPDTTHDRYLFLRSTKPVAAAAAR